MVLRWMWRLPRSTRPPFSTFDQKQGMSAFLEKRKAQFKDA